MQSISRDDGTFDSLGTRMGRESAMTFLLVVPLGPVLLGSVP